MAPMSEEAVPALFAKGANAQRSRIGIRNAHTGQKEK